MPHSDVRPRWLRPLLLALPLVLAACTGDERAAEQQTLRPPGQWLVLNYWAEWCEPCIEEIPELAAFAAANAGRARVLLVNFDGAGGPELAAKAERLGIPRELVLERDPARELGLERPRVLPSTFVIGPDGALRATLHGAQTAAQLNDATRER